VSAARQIRVLDLEVGPQLAIVRGEGTAHAVVWPGIDAQLRSMHCLRLAPGASTIELSHPSEAVYYVVDGHGSVRDPATGDSSALRPGSMFHVDPGTSYVIAAESEPFELVGGPSPADGSLYPSAQGD
jgi:mannose-6-phosphate isomerase-like protein (cupin superfamily)